MGKKHRQRRLSHKSRRWPRSWRRNPSSAKPARADHQHHKGQNHHHCHPVSPQTETHHFKITDLKYDRHPNTDKYDPEDQSPLANRRSRTTSQQETGWIRRKPSWNFSPPKSNISGRQRTEWSHQNHTQQNAIQIGWKNVLQKVSFEPTNITFYDKEKFMTHPTKEQPTPTA